MNVLDTAGLLLFIFYAVSFTKTPFVKLVQDNEWQSWAIRVWALVLGIGAALFDTHLSGNASWTAPDVYDAIKAGGAAAIGAIITYHIGNGDFVGVFDGGTKGLTAVTTVEGTTTKPVTLQDEAAPVATPTPTPPTPTPTTTTPELTPAQKASLVDLKTVTGGGS